MNKWCCSGLAKAFSERTESTIYIYSEQPDDVVNYGPIFWLAMRSIKKTEYDKIKKNHNRTSILATRKPVNFCPWCGANLSKIYPTFPNALTDKKIEKEFNNHP